MKGLPALLLAVVVFGRLSVALADPMPERSETSIVLHPAGTDSRPEIPPGSRGKDAGARQRRGFLSPRRSARHRNPHPVGSQGARPVGGTGRTAGFPYGALDERADRRDTPRRGGDATPALPGRADRGRAGSGPRTLRLGIRPAQRGDRPAPPRDPGDAIAGQARRASGAVGHPRRQDRRGDALGRDRPGHGSARRQGQH